MPQLVIVRQNFRNVPLQPRILGRGRAGYELPEGFFYPANQAEQAPTQLTWSRRRMDDYPWWKRRRE
jgi:hypothetical protein